MEDTERVETVLQEQTVGLCSKHVWQVAEPDPNSELIGLFCSKCNTGISVAKENLSKHLKA